MQAGNCPGCDWKGPDVATSAGGKVIWCEWFGSNRVVNEVVNCSGWTRDLRLPNESRTEFLARQAANRLDSKRYQLALRAHRLAILALALSGLSLLVACARLLIERLP